jgi:hypothetical protein
MLAVGDNSTAIMAALPAMTNSLRLGAAQVEWVVNAYLLAAAVFIILGVEAAGFGLTLAVFSVMYEMEDTLQPGTLMSNGDPHELHRIDKVFFGVDVVDRCWHAMISY